MRRTARRDDVTDLPGVRRVVDTRRGEDLPGIGYASDDTLETYHVTDDPDRVIRFLKRRQNLVASYGEKGRTAELGPGFYTSGNPNYWMGRARGKWSFLKNLTPKDLRRLLAALHRQIREQKRRGHLSANEYAYAIRDLRHVARGMYDPSVLTQIASPPYSIAFWKPEFLTPIGIRGGRRPGIVELRVRGRFAELSGSYPSPITLRLLRRAGLQGAFTRAGMGTNPELVIWDPKAIASARVEQSTGRDPG